MSEPTQRPTPEDRPTPEHHDAAADDRTGPQGSEQTPAQERTDDTERVVVLTGDGMGVHDPHGEDKGPADLVEQPAKVMRIGSMVKQLLEEVRSAPLDEKGRARLAEVHRRSITELEDGLAPELVEELERISLPFSEDAPSDAELRIAQAQLVGWLEGLFHGIQAALFAQQMAAQQQLNQMRRALPGSIVPPAGAGQPPGQPGGPLGPRPGDGGPTGQYL